MIPKLGTLEWFNMMWLAKSGHTRPFTQEELDLAVKEDSNFWQSYYLQEKLAIKHRDNS